MADNCLFCGHDKFELVAENELSYAIRDKFPITKLHTLIICKKHYATAFDIPAEEMASILELAKICKEEILSQDDSVEGFNLSTNVGEVAGQVIKHAHFHLVPRRDDDMVPPLAG